MLLHSAWISNKYLYWVRTESQSYSQNCNSGSPQPRLKQPMICTVTLHRGILNSYTYRSDLIDFESLEAENITDNLNNAFDVAEKQLGIPKLLDTEGC